MIYLEPSTLGWQPLAKSWIASQPEAISGNPELTELLDALFEWIVEPCLDFVRKNVKVTVSPAQRHLLVIP